MNGFFVDFIYNLSSTSNFETIMFDYNFDCTMTDKGKHYSTLNFKEVRC